MNFNIKQISSLPILVIIGGFIIFKAIAIIPAGNVGVLSLFGNVSDTELTSGLHLRNPLANIQKMSIRTIDYTMSSVQGEGTRVGNDAIAALTKEGLSIALDITVFYHLNPEKASDIYKEVGTGYDETIIRPKIRTAIRDVVSQYTAKGVYADARADVTNDIRNQLISLADRGIIIEEVLLRNVQLPQQLAKSIEEKLQAEQDAERLDFVLTKEAKEAERKRIEAQGIKDAQDIISQTLTQNYLKYSAIQMMRELKDNPNTVYLFVPTDSSGLPITTLPLQ